MHSDLRETSLGPRDCLSTSASISGGGDSVVVVISVLVVLVVVGIIVLLAVGGLIYYRKSVPGKATSEFSVTHGSLRRSASRCSYASERSGRSSRSSRSSRSKYVCMWGVLGLASIITHYMLINSSRLGQLHSPCMLLLKCCYYTFIPPPIVRTWLMVTPFWTC